MLIAQDEFRLQDYYAVLRATATAQQLPMPRAYLTTFAQMRALRDDPARPAERARPGRDGPDPAGAAAHRDLERLELVLRGIDFYFCTGRCWNG